MGIGTEQKTAQQQKRFDLFEAREKIVADDGLGIEQQRKMLNSLYTFVERGGEARDFDKRWRVIRAQLLAGQGRVARVTTPLLLARGHTVTVYLN